MFPEEAPLIIMDNKSSVCVAKNDNNTKHIRHISIRMHFVKQSEEFIFHKTVRCEGGLQLSDIGTNNVREYILNPRL